MAVFITGGHGHIASWAAYFLALKYSRYPVSVEIGPGELMQRCEALDISRAREELGFQPQYGLEEGVQRYAAWLERILKK